MKTRLAGVIGLVEIASGAALWLLLRQKGLPSHAALVLVFLLPVAFGLHVTEEFIFPGGAADWFKAYRPRYASAFTPSYLFKLNALPLVGSFLVCLGAFDYVGGFSFGGVRAWLAFVSLQGFNAAFHLRGTIELRRYSPGLVTGVLLYLPLAVLGFACLVHTGVVDLLSAVVCLLIGAVFQPVLDLIKERRMQPATPRPGIGKP
jgi:hypothetical protein